MKRENAINKMLSKLGMAAEPKKTELATATLEDGTTLEAEAFEVGAVVSMLDPDGNAQPVPAGAYALDGIGVIGVDENSVIVEVEAEEAEAAEDAAEEDAELKTEKEELSASDKKVEELSKQLEELSKQVAELTKTNLESEKTIEEKDKSIEDLKTEMSKEPATKKPLKHSPEATEDKSVSVQFSQGRRTNTLDRVMSKMNNIKFN